MSAVLSQTLSGAIAMVTGARGGIGRAVCAAVDAAGGCVVATGIGNAPKELRADAWLRHDATSPDDWACVVAEVRRKYGRLDCLVNNVGMSMVESVANTSIEQFRRVLSVNVESILLGVQASLPLLRDSGTGRSGGSSVVNVSSVAGLRGEAHNAAYCASKGAVTLFTKAAAREFALLGYPIRVNSIHP